DPVALQIEGEGEDRRAAGKFPREGGSNLRGCALPFGVKRRSAMLVLGLGFAPPGCDFRVPPVGHAFILHHRVRRESNEKTLGIATVIRLEVSLDWKGQV